MKPVDLVVRAIKNSSSINDVVLDLFGGSGTTLIAAEETGRICRMMELDQIAPVGSLFSYNNSGFRLLGFIIELVTKKSYEEAIGDLVFTPLVLEKCFFRLAM